jgi:signal transduction histidine kinase/ActR/RegA family two-component response regulator
MSATGRGVVVIDQFSPRGARRSDHGPDANPAPDGAVRSQIDAELVGYVVRQAPIGFAIGTIAVGGVAVVLWNAVPRGALLAWVLAMAALTLPAVLVVWRAHRETDVSAAVDGWRRALTVAYGLAGAGWGVGAMLLYPRIDVAYQTFLLAVLGGAGVSGIAALAPVWTAFVAYLTATWVPLVALLLREGSLPTVATGVLMVAFWVSTLSLAFGLRALLIRALRLHYENAANLETLTHTRDVLQGELSSTTRDVAALANELAAANRARDQFLAIVSHELRTPLTPILTWAALLRRRQLDPETVGRGLDAIERNAKLQARIVDDLLDESRIVMGKLEIDVRPMALDGVIHAAVDALRPAADAKGVRCAAELDRDVPWISGDPERLQQVVWNLVANAVKFTPRGGRIDVRLSAVPDGVRLTVDDDGIGIAPASLPRLFERFWQSDTSASRQHGGLGLGLAVVRHMVELHGGTVGAESAGEGQGATFTITLPALAADHTPRGTAPVRDDRAAAPAARLRGLRLLVVDDEPEACEVISAVLGGEGADVRTCCSSTAALAVLDTWLPDVIVSDIAMPGEDGYALMRKIRARKAEVGGRVLAVALTAYGGHEARTQALSAGFQIHVGKPVAPDQLVGIVASVVKQHVAPH